MRLSQAETDAILVAVETHLLPSFRGMLFLFGSQVDDRAKGGDIDLLLVVESLADLQNLKMVDYKMVAAMKMSPVIGDQKIDFQVVSLDESQKGFFSQALKKSIALKRW